MDLSTLIFFIVYLVNLGLLIFILFHRDRSRSWPFFWLVLLIVLWQSTELLNIIWLAYLDHNILLFSVQAGLLPALYMPYVLIKLVFSLFGRWQKVSNFKKSLWMLPAVIMSFFVFTPYNLSGLVVTDSGRFFYMTGSLWYYFALYFVAMLSYGIYFLVKNREVSGPIVRRQINYILVAVTLAAGSGLFFNILLPIFGLYNLYYLGPSATIFFTTIVTYALFRYRFFDLRVSFYQALINSFKLFVTVFCYYLLYILLADLLLVNLANLQNLVFLLLVAVLTAPFLFNFVSRMLTLLFINPANDFKMAGNQVADILSSGRDLDILLSRLSKEISKVIDYREMFIYLSKKRDLNVFYQIFPAGERLLKKSENNLVKYLAGKKKIANLAEIEYFFVDKMLIEEMKESRIDAALPIFYNKQLLGIVIIDNGRKLFSIQELDFLEELNKYLNIAIGSILLYQQDMAEKKPY